MNYPSVDTLLLTDDELQLARQQIEELAYRKWQAAGCPVGDPDTFWQAAEREWIEYRYVPDRAVCASEA